jgi:serine/threonine protein kinase
MPDAVTHPTAQELAAFGLGKLPERVAAAVAAHLKHCAACRQAARAPGLTAATQPPGSRQPVPAEPPNLPPELANHPRYRVLRELGRGGMGVVYHAEQTLMHRAVAIKVISKALLDQPNALERFHREAQAAAKLAHPNIVIAYDAEQAGDLHMLVMEFVEGQSLDQVLRRKGPLPVAHSCSYVRQAALGLQHAFEQGMVHRDIKPANLMLTPKGQVKILDFGLARLRSEQAQDGRLTQDGAFMGTPQYVAPEQATDARKADIRADVYSLGCTLYCLLAGCPPFAGGTPVQLVLAHLEQEPPSLQEVRPAVPPELAAVVTRMLAKDPAARYQTPAEVARALAPFARSGAKPEPARETLKGSRGSKLPGAGKGATTLSATSPLEGLAEHARPRGAPNPARRKRKLGLLIGAAVATLAAVVVLAGVLLKTRVKTPDREATVPPAERTPAEKWFAVGTRWEGKTVITKPIAREFSAWFTVQSRERNKFKGRLVGEGRGELSIEGTLEDDGTSLRWNTNTVRHVPNVWSPEQPPYESFEGSGKCSAENARVDWKWPQPDGRVVEGFCEFTIRRDGPRNDNEVVWPPPLHPRLAGIGTAGKWSIQGGELVQEAFIETDNNGGWPWIMFGDLAWKDYDFHLKAMRTAGDHGFIVFFDKLRATKNAAWCIGFPPGQVMFLRVEEPLPTGLRFTPLSESKVVALADNQWYDILIKTRGQWIECFLDGESVFKVSHLDRWGGKLGFFCVRMAGRFKDIEVKAPDGKVLWKGPPELPQ